MVRESCEMKLSCAEHVVDQSAEYVSGKVASDVSPYICAEHVVNESAEYMSGKLAPDISPIHLHCRS